MTLEKLRAYCLSLPAAVENQPWTDPRYQYLVTYTVGGRWFCLLDIDEQRVNIKCNPERVVEMQSRYNGAFPAWHMNKEHWLGVKLESDIPEDVMKTLLRDAHSLIVSRLPRKLRAESGLL